MHNWVVGIELTHWTASEGNYSMGRLAELVDDFNNRLTTNPGRLPDKLFRLELSDGPVFCLDGATDQLIEGEPDRSPDCTITGSAKALETLLDDPKQAVMLVLTGKLKFDNAAPVMLLAASLQNLLAL